jgi:hypothetical protein
MKSHGSFLLDASNSFSAVVLFLKILLSQQGLDIPFEGGLGSYKLYVLLSRHIQLHIDLGGNDRPSEILLSFLYRYGGSPSKSQSSTKTKRDKLERFCSNPAFLTSLDQDVSVRSRDTSGIPGAVSTSGVADLSNVYKLCSVVNVFQESYRTIAATIIRKLYSAAASTKGKSKLKVETMNEPRQSLFLGEIIDFDQLSKDRKKCYNAMHLEWKQEDMEKFQQFDSYLKETNHTPNKGQSFFSLLGQFLWLWFMARLFLVLLDAMHQYHPKNK